MNSQFLCGGQHVLSIDLQLFQQCLSLQHSTQTLCVQWNLSIKTFKLHENGFLQEGVFI